LQQWGERQQIQLKDDWSLLTQEQRRRKADELIAIIRELQQPPMRPPHLVYRAEEAPDEREPVRALSQLDRPLGRKAEGARLEGDATRPLLMARTPPGAELAGVSKTRANPHTPARARQIAVAKLGAIGPPMRGLKFP
jgi:hypothetical protein